MAQQPCATNAAAGPPSDDAGAAAAAASSGFGAASQCPVWLLPRGSQCCFWHLLLQHHARRHRAHRLLTLSRPGT